MTDPTNPTDKPRGLKAADFLAAGKRLRQLDLPDLGGVVYFRPLSAAMAIKFSELADGDLAGQYEIIASCLVDEAGERLFSPEESSRLGELPAELYGKLMRALNAGLLGEAEEQGKG